VPMRPVKVARKTAETRTQALCQVCGAQEIQHQNEVRFTSQRKRRELRSAFALGRTHHRKARQKPEVKPKTSKMNVKLYTKGLWQIVLGSRATVAES